MAQLLECGPLSFPGDAVRGLYGGVSVSLDEGELTVLEGESGGGKSTLLRQIAGLAPSGGAFRRLGGREFAPNDMATWRAEVTLLMQDAPLLPASVERNLAFPFSLAIAGERMFDRDSAQSVLKAVDLDYLDFDREIVTLSGGERHRLALARGLLWDPAVLLADEPLSGLDPDRARKCFGLLSRFATRPGHAVLCVLHDPVLAANVQNRVRLTLSGLEAA